MAGSADMTGKVVLITGGTSGIGEVTARELANLGAQVILVGRGRDKGEAICAEINARPGAAPATMMAADLSTQAGVRRFADEFRARHDRLDVLINNAGAIFARRQETADGIERTFGLNHLAYFLLTGLLLDLLKSGAPSRVVNVASDAHRKARRMNFDDLEAKTRYQAFPAYCQSKLANILFTRELSRRLEGSGVTANALHPGFVATNFFSGNGLLGWAMRRAAGLFAIPPERGAETSIYLASSPEVEGVSGLYFDRRKAVEPSKAALDDAAARRLWEISERMTGLAGAGTPPESGT